MGFPPRVAVLPRRAKLFWFSVQTVYPRSSHRQRFSLTPAVWASCQPTRSNPLGALAQLQPSCWARNHAAHSQEFSPASNLVNQVTQIYRPFFRSSVIPALLHRFPRAAPPENRQPSLPTTPQSPDQDPQTTEGTRSPATLRGTIQLPETTHSACTRMRAWVQAGAGEQTISAQPDGATRIPTRVQDRPTPSSLPRAVAKVSIGDGAAFLLSPRRAPGDHGVIPMPRPWETQDTIRPRQGRFPTPNGPKPYKQVLTQPPPNKGQVEACPFSIPK